MAIITNSHNPFSKKSRLASTSEKLSDAAQANHVILHKQHVWKKGLKTALYETVISYCPEDIFTHDIFSNIHNDMFSLRKKGLRILPWIFYLDICQLPEEDITKTFSIIEENGKTILVFNSFLISLFSNDYNDPDVFEYITPNSNELKRIEEFTNRFKERIIKDSSLVKIISTSAPKNLEIRYFVQSLFAEVNDSRGPLNVQLDKIIISRLLDYLIIPSENARINVVCTYKDPVSFQSTMVLISHILIDINLKALQ